MSKVNYVAVVPLTFDERVAMYMKCDKEELARMLAESAKYTNPQGCKEIVDNEPVQYSVTTSASTSTYEFDSTYID